MDKKLFRKMTGLECDNQIGVIHNEKFYDGQIMMATLLNPD